MRLTLLSMLILDSIILCYKIMPFDLVNVGQTYQRMINNLFKNMFGQNMKVYVDDMMVEYVQGDLHVTDL